MQRPVELERPASGSAISGWIDACLYLLAVSVLNIAYTAASAWGAHVVVFILYSMLASSGAMLVAGGLGAEPLRIMLARPSWFFGFANIAMEIAYCMTLLTIAPGAAAVLGRLSIPFALLAGAVFLGRRPRLGIWLSGAIITAGVGLVVATLDPVQQGAGIVYGIIGALLICARAFAIEFHPWNRKARTVREKLRVTGLVVLFTGLVGVLLVVATAFLVGLHFLARTELIPGPQDLAHGPTILFATLVGGIVFTAMNYMQFSAVVKIRTENFLAITAFVPIGALLLQLLVAHFGLLAFPPFDWQMLPGMALVVSGVLLLIRAQARTL